VANAVGPTPPPRAPIVLPELARRAAEPDFPWTPMRPGVDIHVLWGRQDQGPSAALLRYAPGAGVPLHVHDANEIIYVLAGSQVDALGVHRAGTMLHNPPGSSHRVSSPEGCLVLAFWERPVRFVE